MPLVDFLPQANGGDSGYGDALMHLIALAAQRVGQGSQPPIGDFMSMMQHRGVGTGLEGLFQPQLAGANLEGPKFANPSHLDPRLATLLGQQSQGNIMSSIGHMSAGFGSGGGAGAGMPLFK